jgi:hypothetical protein
MPVTKTILKKTRQQVVVAMVGDGTSTVDLDADCRLADETFRGYANCNVNINSIVFSVPDTAPTLVQRNTSNVLVVVGNDNWSFNQQFGYVVSQNNTANISVTIPSFGGTVFLSLTKNSGYSEPNQQIKY